MDVMFTTGDGPGKHYMAIAEAEGWKEVLDHLDDIIWPSPATAKLIEGLRSWGI